MAIEEKLFDKLDNYYGSKDDHTMINYVDFCSDLDIVFNLPVLLL